MNGRPYWMLNNYCKFNRKAFWIEMEIWHNEIMKGVKDE